MQTSTEPKPDQSTDHEPTARPLGPATQAVHAGEARQKSGDAITDAIFCAATYTSTD